MRVALICRLVVAALAASLAPASPAAAKTLVSYEQSGGIAGFQTAMSVSVGGMASVTSNRSAGIERFRLSAAQLRALKRDLREAHFSTLRRIYDSKVPVADGISQIVRYAGFRVTASTGGHPPARLRKVLTRLARLASRAD